MYPPEDRVCPMCDKEFEGYSLFCSPACEKAAKQEEDELAEGWEDVSIAEDSCY
jgi:hypothetical protein